MAAFAVVSWVMRSKGACSLASSNVPVQLLSSPMAARQSYARTGDGDSDTDDSDMRGPTLHDAGQQQDAAVKLDQRCLLSTICSSCISKSSSVSSCFLFSPHPFHLPSGYKSLWHAS